MMRSLANKRFVSTRISHVRIELEPFNIDLNSLFYRSNDSRGNSNIGRWCWSLDGGEDYTMSSLRREVARDSWTPLTCPLYGLR